MGLGRAIRSLWRGPEDDGWGKVPTPVGGIAKPWPVYFQDTDSFIRFVNTVKALAAVERVTLFNGNAGYPPTEDPEEFLRTVPRPITELQVMCQNPNGNAMTARFSHRDRPSVAIIGGEGPGSNRGGLQGAIDAHATRINRLRMLWPVPVIVDMPAPEVRERRQKWALTFYGFMGGAISGLLFRILVP